MSDARYTDWRSFQCTAARDEIDLSFHSLFFFLAMTSDDCEQVITIRVVYLTEKCLRMWVTTTERSIVSSPRFLIRYSTFVVKYSWAFLLLGIVICFTLGLSAVFLRDLPDFNDPTKVTKTSNVEKKNCSIRSLCRVSFLEAKIR